MFKTVPYNINRFLYMHLTHYIVFQTNNIFLTESIKIRIKCFKNFKLLIKIVFKIIGI